MPLVREIRQGNTSREAIASITKEQFSILTSFVIVNSVSFADIRE